MKKKFAAIKVLFLRHVDIEKLLVSNKISSGEKTRNTLLVTWPHVMLPKTSAYVKSCDGQTKWMYF